MNIIIALILIALAGFGLSKTSAGTLLAQYGKLAVSAVVLVVYAGVAMLRGRRALA